MMEQAKNCENLEILLFIVYRGIERYQWNYPDINFSEL